VAMWVDQHLQQTACSGQDFAAAVTIRRLNRRDYGNTIRDLLGASAIAIGARSRQTERKLAAGRVFAGSDAVGHG